MRLSFVQPPVLNSGEEILMDVGATRQDPDALPVGGRVYLTNQRLLHQPGLSDRVVRAKPWESFLGDIHTVIAGDRFTSVNAGPKLRAFAGRKVRGVVGPAV